MAVARLRSAVAKLIDHSSLERLRKSEGRCGKAIRQIGRAAEAARIQIALLRLLKSMPGELYPGLRRLLTNPDTMSFLARYGEVPVYAATGERFAKYSHTFHRYCSLVLQIEFILERMSEGKPLKNGMDTALFFASTARRGLNHIASILHLSLTGMSASKPEEFDAVKIIQDCIDSFKGEKKFSEVEIKAELPDSLLVFMDPRKFQDVLVNIFLNASEAMGGGYSGDGFTKIHNFCIRGRKLSGRKMVELTLTDTGKGFDREDEHAFFRPFSSTKSKRDREIRGLGLFVSRQMMQEAGGDYVLTSPGKNKGATVKLLVPARNRLTA